MECKIDKRILEKVYKEKGYPTKKGFKKYPPHGIYFGDFFDEPEFWEFWEVCTCKDDCPSNCNGQCGCEACHMEYHDFLSLDFD